MPEKHLGAKCRDRAVQVEKLAKPLDAAGEGAQVLEGAGGSLGTVRKTSPGETVPEKEDKVHGHNRAGRKASKAAGRCGGGCGGFGGGRRQSWNRKKDISRTEPCR